MSQFSSDAFTGTEGDSLTTYNAAWQQPTGSPGTAEIASGRARNSSTSVAEYYKTDTPPSADYKVPGNLYAADASTSRRAGVTARGSTGARTYYAARLVTGTGWQIIKVVAGTVTQLGSSVAQSVSAGSSYAVEIRVEGTTISLYKLGESTPAISVTDSAISAAGYPGLYFNQVSGDALGLHVDSYSAETLTSDQTLTPSLFTNAQTFYAPTVSTGAVTLTPVQISNAQSFHAPSASAYNTLAPGLLSNTSAFHAPVVELGAVTLSQDLLSNDQTFYAPTVGLEGGGGQTLEPGLFSNASGFFAPTVSPGAVTLLPGLFIDPDTFFSPVVDLAGSQTLAPALLDNASTFFAPDVAPGAATVAPPLLENASVFFSADVAQGPGSAQLLPTLYTNVQAFFDATVLPGEVAILAPLLENQSTFFGALVFSGTPYVPTKQVFVVTTAPRAFVSTEQKRVAVNTSEQRVFVEQ
jgi:hypothetical protein